jgi:thiamine-phosphate pyrophosphorylase
MQTSESAGESPRPDWAGAWRVIDASANRAAEALRVLEDVARFGLDDVPLTALAKDLRHELAAILAGEPLRCRAASRDVGGDVGVGMAAAAAMPRVNGADLVAANAARGTQALRSLQECAAIVAPASVPGFERIRYRLYDLERGLLAVLRARDLLADISLCVLIDGRDGPAAFARMMESLVEAGVRMIQVRDKGLTVPELAARVAQAVAIARRRDPAVRPLVVVNDRVDVAAATGAGAHVGADDLPVLLARRVLGPTALVGRTAHDVAEARAAAAAGADYLGIGPCFPSATKAFAAQATPDFLHTVIREIALPSFAIGGISAERLADLAALGVTRVAVASAVTQARDPARAARDLIDGLARLAASGTR